MCVTSRLRRVLHLRKALEVAALSGGSGRKYITHSDTTDVKTNKTTAGRLNEMKPSASRTSQFHVPDRGPVRKMKRPMTAESDLVQQIASLGGKAGGAQQRHRLTTTTNAAKADDTTARRDTMTVRKIMMTATVMKEAVEATEHAVPQQIRSTAAVGATKRNTAHHGLTATAVRNTVAAIAHAHLVRKTSTTTMPM